MKEERHEILKMVAEGVLDVAGAERLLDAIADGERRPTTTPPSTGVPDRRTLRAGGTRGRTTPVPAPEGRFLLPEESVLVVRNEPHRPGGGSVSIRPATGDRCAVECEGPFSVSRDGERFFVDWEYGDIVVDVPAPIAGLSVGTHGGNVEIEGVQAPTRVQTLGGDLRLRGLTRELQATTAGGNVRVSFDALSPGSASEITTQGGDLFVEMAREASGVVKLSTLAGEVRVEEGLGRVFETSKSMGPHNVTVEVGDTPRQAEVTARTLRGNVFLGRPS